MAAYDKQEALSQPEGIAIRDNLFQNSFLIFTGIFNWLPYAKDCMITIVFPSGLREKAPALAYWQWDADAKGMHSKAEYQGVIDVLRRSSDQHYIRFFKGSYYFFEGQISNPENRINLTMWNEIQTDRDDFKVVLSFSK